MEIISNYHLYRQQHSDWHITEVSPTDVNIEQAKDCFINWLLVSAEIFEGQNRAVLSSGSLFLNVEWYKKLWWDIDIATDVQTFINIPWMKQIEPQY